MADATSNKQALRKSIAPSNLARSYDRGPDVKNGPVRRATVGELMQYNLVLDYYDKQEADKWLTASWA